MGEFAKAPGRPCDKAMVLQAFMDGFVAGVARTSISGFASEHFASLDDNPMKQLAMSSAVSGITAAFTDLMSNLFAGRSFKEASGRAATSLIVNTVLSLAGDGIAAKWGDEVLLKEVVAEGLGFFLGLPVPVLLAEK